jgi:hypothetical protein
MIPVEDAYDLHQFWSDPVVCKYTDFIFHTKEEITGLLQFLSKDFQDYKRIRWGICL